MNSIEIRNCEDAQGSVVIAKGNPATFILGVLVGVGLTVYVINRLGKNKTEEIVSTATQVIKLSTLLKVA